MAKFRFYLTVFLAFLGMLALIIFAATLIAWCKDCQPSEVLNDIYRFIADFAMAMLAYRLTASIGNKEK